MAAPALTHAALPAEPQLRAFARAAGHLLSERQPRASGARAVGRRPGAGIELHDHRNYVPGDEVRHIDWRLTARRQQTVVRRFEAESVSDWTIVIDASSSMTAGGGRRWHAALQAAAAMCYAPLQLGHRVGLLAFGERVLAHCPRGRGRHHYAAIAALLSSLQPDALGQRSALGACARHLHGKASVFVISDFLADDEMRHDLTVLASRCTALHALQLGCVDDLSLPAAGDVELLDVETGEQQPARIDAAALAFAAAERAAMTARLRGFCSRAGIAYSDWDLAQSWQQTLVQHLAGAQSTC